MKKKLEQTHVTQNHVTKKQIVTLVLTCFFFLLLLFPLPYYIESPGSAESLTDVITVDGKSDDDDGNFMMTTVSMRRANLLFMLISQFNRNEEIIPRREILGSSNTKEYEILQEYNMKNSQNEAIQVSLELANIPYEKQYDGIFVMSVEPYSTFHTSLFTGDVVTKLNGKQMASSKEFTNSVQNMQIGEAVDITYLHNDSEKVAKGTIIELPETDKKGIGISFIDKTSIDTQKDIQFHTEKVSGPSAGFMFSLELYSMLSQTNLKQGRNIAGTGTIDSEGYVGRIGGIDKKVVAAEKSGATIFFAPDDDETPSNFEEAKASAKRNHLSIQIIPVHHINDAISYLKEDTTK